jgi:arylsulfatase A-like enzyme
VRFEDAYAASASTGPSHATLFTALAPPRHGVVKDGLRLAEQHETLAERLRARRFQTASLTLGLTQDLW